MKLSIDLSLTDFGSVLVKLLSPRLICSEIQSISLTSDQLRISARMARSVSFVLTSKVQEEGKSIRFYEFEIAGPFARSLILKKIRKSIAKTLRRIGPVTILGESGGDGLQITW
jgi:hypothetical protein